MAIYWQRDLPQPNITNLQVIQRHFLLRQNRYLRSSVTLIGEGAVRTSFMNLKLSSREDQARVAAKIRAIGDKYFYVLWRIDGSFFYVRCRFLTHDGLIMRGSMEEYRLRVELSDIPLQTEADLDALVGEMDLSNDVEDVWDELTFNPRVPSSRSSVSDVYGGTEKYINFASAADEWVNAPTDINETPYGKDFIVRPNSHRPLSGPINAWVSDSSTIVGSSQPVLQQADIRIGKPIPADNSAKIILNSFVQHDPFDYEINIQLIQDNGGTEDVLFERTFQNSADSFPEIEGSGGVRHLRVQFDLEESPNHRDVFLRIINPFDEEFNQDHNNRHRVAIILMEETTTQLALLTRFRNAIRSYANEMTDFIIN